MFIKLPIKITNQYDEKPYEVDMWAVGAGINELDGYDQLDAIRELRKHLDSYALESFKQVFA
jgi:hypothetical protein